MKPIIKTAAFALLITLLSACKLTESGNNSAAQPLNSATPSSESISPTPNSPVVPEKTAVAEKLDKNGEEWRHIKLTGENGFDLARSASQGKSKTTQYATRIYEQIFEENQGLKNSDLASTNTYYVDLNQYNQGVNSGVISGEPSEFEVREYEYNPETNTISVWLTNKVNYHIINQPYSSYGVLFTNRNNVKQFIIGQNAGLEGAQNIEYQVGKLDGENVVWNKEVEGSATYKGDVIIVNTKVSTFDKPTVDGTITLKANFVNGVDKSTVSAELDSKTVGKVNFEKAENGFDGIIRKNGSFYFKDPEHFLTGYFVGKDFNDAVGRIQVFNSDYEAVFGATKQK